MIARFLLEQQGSSYQGMISIIYGMLIKVAICLFTGMPTIAVNSGPTDFRISPT